ncbi:MAG: hypothetical protein ACJ0HT_05775 [Alphaproteobacteria bacterium]|jgi:hypothetical protein|tara:strand:+ start:11 stop:211 length:201 start_codon:yes stop_codon:yes gene_type:complete
MADLYEKIIGRCNSCRHYDSEPFGAVNYGQCRYYPPQTIDKQPEGLPRGIWPVVGYDDYCSKFDEV